MKAKYVMTTDGPILFPESFLHKQFAYLNITSAGRVSITEDAVKVFGNSISLGLSPAYDDEWLIASAFDIQIKEGE